MVADYINENEKHESLVLSYGVYNNLAWEFKHNPYYRHATAITICPTKKDAERMVKDREKVNKAENREMKFGELMSYLKRKDIEEGYIKVQ